MGIGRQVTVHSMRQARCWEPDDIVPMESVESVSGLTGGTGVRLASPAQILIPRFLRRTTHVGRIAP